MTKTDTSSTARPGPTPLHDYDHARYGPLLGISDGGDAANAIVAAAQRSAKATALGADAGIVGLILDAERMGSAGEVPVGPHEYEVVRAAAAGKTLLSTNVGVRANARCHQPFPVVAVAADADVEALARQVLALFEPYLRTPDRRPRPMCVHLAPAADTTAATTAAIMARIESARGSSLASDAVHRVALLRSIDAGQSADAERLRGWIDDCAASAVQELVIDGAPVEAARIRLGVQGLLNSVDPTVAAEGLHHAATRKLRLAPRFRTDVETATRTIWAGLAAARAQGLNAAKYGLVPLTFEEQRSVIQRVQGWFADWTSIPAFYADTPLVTEATVYLGDRLVEAARLWLEMAATAGARLVLFDCPDRFTPRIDIVGQGASRTLVKTSKDDARGAFSLAEIEALHAFARGLGVAILWSGGIQPAHAFELGRIGAAGFFTTGSTAIQVAVGPSLDPDPRLPSQASPTELGVRRVHAISQAGFQAGRLAGSDPRRADELKSASATVERAAANSDELTGALERLDALLIAGWESTPARAG